MDDRELLEMAAKAFGVKYQGCVNDQHYAMHPSGYAIGFNPLNEDGDALRLAVKLRIGLHWCKSGRIYAHTETVDECESSREHAAENTRRAVVRAAAEIGRAM